MFGALAFGFSTYLIIILGVGHNTKALALGYLPLVLSGFLITLRGDYLKGFIISSLFLNATMMNTSTNSNESENIFIILGLNSLIVNVRSNIMRHVIAMVYIE